MIRHEILCELVDDLQTNVRWTESALRNDVVSGIKLGTFGREEGSMVPRQAEGLWDVANFQGLPEINYDKLPVFAFLCT
jgi:hypothetical protein